MNVHFIAIGGSAMHNLAIALHKKGIVVTGSDDEIFEPSKSRLKSHGLLPDSDGWDAARISTTLDAVILGMHARPDNPELLRARELGLTIYSYPEFLYLQTQGKKRVVIAGSHGKTTTTSMVMHVLKFHGIKFDYMVGASVEGFDTMVGLSHEAEIAVFEGDEYLSSPIDPRPKFLHYHPHIALITGIAWDHINVFPTFDGYVDQFNQFISGIEPDGTLIFFTGDQQLVQLAEKHSDGMRLLPYSTYPHVVVDGMTFAKTPEQSVGLQIFGEHNLQNLAGALEVCLQLGLGKDQFFEAIASFRGSSRRLEVVARTEQCTVFYDFAHSPSKLMATTKAVKAQFPDRRLIAVMELHTFSSLKKSFLPQYQGCMDAADQAFVYFDRHTIAHKRLEDIHPDEVTEAFGRPDLNVYTHSGELFDHLRTIGWRGTNLLIMSSGNFSGQNIKAFALELVQSIT